MHAVHHDVGLENVKTAAVPQHEWQPLTPSDYIFDVSDDDLEVAATQISASQHTIFTMKQLNCRC